LPEFATGRRVIEDEFHAKSVIVCPQDFSAGTDMMFSDAGGSINSLIFEDNFNESANVKLKTGGRIDAGPMEADIADRVRERDGTRPVESNQALRLDAGRAPLFSRIR